MAPEFQVTFDCGDPAALADFWAEVLGYQKPRPPGDFETWEAALSAMGVPAERNNDASALEDPGGAGPRLYFQRVPEGKTAKNRLHLDVRAAPDKSGDERMVALEQEAARLVALGATRIVRHEPEPPLQAGHVILEDPEGNVFCLD